MVQPPRDPRRRPAPTRREFLRAAGGAAGLATLAPLLAACSGSEQVDPFAGESAGIVHVANWPLYLDRERNEDGTFRRPSLELFTEETGIAVNYREVIPDAETLSIATSSRGWPPGIPPAGTSW